MCTVTSDHSASCAPNTSRHHCSTSRRVRSRIVHPRWRRCAISQARLGNRDVAVTSRATHRCGMHCDVLLRAHISAFSHVTHGETPRKYDDSRGVVDCDWRHEYLGCLYMSRGTGPGSRGHPKGKLVNKNQLIDALAARYDGNKKAARHALESVLDTITREVAKGEKVAITGFGSFEKRVRNARMVRNPQTGERIRAKATHVPKFTAGQDLKNIVSGAKKLPKLTLEPRRRSPGGRCGCPAKRTPPRRLPRRPRRRLRPRRPLPRSRRPRRPRRRLRPRRLLRRRHREEGSGQEGTCEEGAGQEGARQEGARQEGAREEGSGQEGAGQEGAREEGSGQEGTCEEGAGQEGSCQEGARQEGTCEEGREEVLTQLPRTGRLPTREAARSAVRGPTPRASASSRSGQVVDVAAQPRQRGRDRAAHRWRRAPGRSPDRTVGRSRRTPRCRAWCRARPRRRRTPPHPGATASSASSRSSARTAGRSPVQRHRRRAPAIAAAPRRRTGAGSR